MGLAARSDQWNETVLMEMLNSRAADLRQSIEQSPVWRVKNDLLQSVPGIGKPSRRRCSRCCRSWAPLELLTIVNAMLAHQTSWSGQPARQTRQLLSVIVTRSAAKGPISNRDRPLRSLRFLRLTTGR
jgi:hypothetical protein